MIEKFDTSVKLAEKVLLKRGRISLKEIQYVPFVEGELEAIAVAQNLIDKYDELEVVDDKWNGEITLYLPAAKRRRAGGRRRRSPARTVAG